MDFYFSKNMLVKRILDWTEWIVIILTGITFNDPKLPDSLFIFISGIFFILAGIWIHHLSHKAHKQAHEPKEKITKIVTYGIYSKIRHPGYLGYIFGYLGIFMTIGSYSILIIISLFTASFIQSIINEERYLTQKFGDEYLKYRKKVPWKLIPMIY